MIREHHPRMQNLRMMTKSSMTKRMTKRMTNVSMKKMQSFFLWKSLKRAKRIDQKGTDRNVTVFLFVISRTMLRRMHLKHILRSLGPSSMLFLWSTRKLDYQRVRLLLPLNPMLLTKNVC